MPPMPELEAEEAIGSGEAVALVGLATWLRVPFVGLQLARYVQTLWCCQRPDAPVSLFGFEMEARWLPLASAGERTKRGAPLASS